MRDAAYDGINRRYFDNLWITQDVAVPEPTVAVLLSAGLLVVGLRRQLPARRW
jgi:hypothetical protein